MPTVTIADRDTATFETLTISSSANGVGITPAIRLPVKGSDFAGMQAQEAFLTLETANIRYRLDGAAPTASVGHLLFVGQDLTLRSVNDVKNFLSIRVSSDATLTISCRFGI